MSGVIAGLGLSALGTGASLIQGIQQKKLQKDADRAASEAMDQAREKLSVNRMEGLQIPLDAYEQAMRETTAQSGQAIDALQQGDPRLLAAGLGKVYQAGSQDIEQTRQNMGQDIYGRDLAIIKAQQDIDMNLADLSLAEASGAQIASAQHEQQANTAFSGAIKSVGDMGAGLMGMQSLYGREQAPVGLSSVSAAPQTGMIPTTSQQLNQNATTQSILGQNFSNRRINN